VFALASLPIVVPVGDGDVSAERAFNGCLDTMADLPQEAQEGTRRDLWVL